MSLTVEMTQASAARLTSEQVLLSRVADRLEIECSDGKLSASQVKYVKLAISARLAAAQIPWGTSTEDLTEGLQRLGVKRDRALELAQLLRAEGNLRDAIESISDDQAVALVTGLLNSTPGVQANVRRADQPAPQPAPKADRPPVHINPTAEGELPDLDAARALEEEQS